MNTTQKTLHYTTNRMARTWCAVLLAGVMALGCSGRASAAPVNSLFNPADYPVLTNDFTLTSGTVYIDTKNGTNAPTWSNGTTVLYGQVVTNQSGSNVLALFSFGNLALSNVVSCTVTGNLGMVLCSTGNITLANTLDLSGWSGSAGGLGGPGGDAGVPGTSFKSSPPDVNHGKGGSNQNGYGYGGGLEKSDGTCGSGGGYGGFGGWVLWNSATAAGGTNYGDSVLVHLFGGSGGAGSSQVTGGGGGGALELIANGTLTHQCHVDPEGQWRAWCARKPLPQRRRRQRRRLDPGGQQPERRRGSSGHRRKRRQQRLHPGRRWWWRPHRPLREHAEYERYELVFGWWRQGHRRERFGRQRRQRRNLSLRRR
jgi:hypothetical protein